MKKIPGIFLICLVVAQSLFAQPQVSILLLDQSSYMPIAGATFQYADQSGISDNRGAIEFTYIDGETMRLSHLGYGEWILSDAALQEAMKSGKLYRENINVTLYPVTVIAIRQRFDEAETLDLDYQEKMAHDAGALLNQITAISSIRKSGNYGFDPVLRGFKYDQINVVLNGAQCATAACPNRMDPPTSQMAPNMTERIEVLKGPHALRYGGSFGGTINFIPAPLRFSDRLKPYGRFSTGYDNNGNISRGEGLLGFSGQRYDLGIFASWSKGNDYTAGDGSKVKAAFSRNSVGANLGVKLSDNQQIRLSATHNIARDVDFPALPMDLRSDNTWMLNVRHDIKFATGNIQSWNTTVFGSFVEHKMDNQLKNLDPRTLNAETIASTHNYGGRTEGIWSFRNGSLYAGADLRIEGAEGNRVREFLMGPNTGKVFTDNAWQNGWISKTGAFAEYHFHKGSFRWVFSGRLELNNADIKDAEPEFTLVFPETKSTQVNPSISIGGIKNFEHDIALGLWLGHARRSGSLIERFINYFPVGQDPYEMLGNPGLNPEINHQADLTFEWKTLHSSLKVDIFAAYLQDVISSLIDTTLSPRLPNSPGVRQFVNIGQALKSGFEAAWGQKLFAGLQYYLSIAYTFAQDLERDEPLPEISPLDFRYSLLGNYLDNTLKPEMTFRYVLMQSRISEEFGETPSPAFALLDVKLSYQFHKILGVTAGIQNLFDKHYYEHLNRSVRGNNPNPIYAPGRNFFISLNLNFM
jgi:iron complex outermembrane recepter protein